MAGFEKEIILRAKAAVAVKEIPRAKGDIGIINQVLLSFQSVEYGFIMPEDGKDEPVVTVERPYAKFGSELKNTFLIFVFQFFISLPAFVQSEFVCQPAQLSELF